MPHTETAATKAARQKQYWESHPEQYEKQKQRSRDYMRKIRADPEARKAARDRDAITRLRNKGYVVLEPKKSGGDSIDAQRSEELP